jgi:hypothetical protein
MAQPKIRNYGSSTRKVSSGNTQKPSAEEVDDFHTNSDLDLRLESQHHTLGPSPSQAAPGDHVHDGGDSALILDGFTISGSRASDTWRLSVNALLVRLGATDSSSA